MAGREICTLGNSLGGFLAVLATRFVPVTTCAVIVPQFSVNPEVMPDETRWQNYIHAVEAWRVRSLDGHFSARTRYCVIPSAKALDVMHAQRFPVADNIIHVIPRPSNHAVAERLKDLGALPDILTAIWHGRFFPDWMTARTGLRVDVLSPAPAG